MLRDIPLLIIGAGPAGLSTALHLQQREASWAERLLIVERAAHPRPKLCGGGVTRLGLEHLRGLGLPDPLPIPHALVNDARFRYRDRTVHVRGNPEFAVFHRQEFDHFLAQTARERGLQIRENERITRIERRDGEVLVHSDRGSYRAQAVVGADGSRGVTRNTLLPAAARRPRTARLLEGLLPALGDAPQFEGGYATFDFSSVKDNLQGYTWDFPAWIGGQAHHNRGIYDARIARGRPKAGLPGLLRRALRRMGSDPDAVEIEGHPIHWFSPGNRIAGEHLLLAGDAAGAEPLFGEGIAPALAYGKIAARSVHAAFENGDFSFRSYRRRVLFSRLGGYLMLRWWVAWWSYRFSGSNAFMHSMWTAGGLLAAMLRPQGKEK